MLWWAVAVTGAAGAQSAIFLSAVCLATSGLLLAWHAVRARFGDVDLRALGGMVYEMPRFSTLLCLLALAALGFPPFGVFAGLLGMLFDPSFRPSAGLAVVLFAWLSSSWYFLWLIQQLLFGRRQSALPYTDLRQAEYASLLILLVLLTVLGLVPGRLLGADRMAGPSNVALGATWIR
jgi:NADH-quinone oxidoreductase subunit M